MPTARIPLEELYRLVGRRLSIEELRELLLKTKCDHDFEAIDNEILVETTSDRLDMLSVEGFARALRYLLGLESGIREYKAESPRIRVMVDESVKEVRPVMVAGVIRGVELSDEAIAALMEFQEKLHDTLGRRRVRVSIGVHDLGKVKPPFTYKAVEPDSVRFVPLQPEPGEMPSELMGKPLTLREIVEHHPKGRSYGWIVRDHRRWPLITDVEGNVLSFPPVINGVLTAITEQTRDMFIDVTGLDYKACHSSLVLLATSLAERGGKIERVLLDYPDRQVETPDLTASELEVEADLVRRVTGLNLSGSEICQLAKAAGLEAKLSGSRIKVVIPPYRLDFLHPVDFAEEIAIAYGYHKIAPELPRMLTIGRPHPLEKFTRKVRELMAGLGFQEVATYMLTSPALLPEAENAVELANPVSSSYSVVRTSLLPGLLQFLSKNKHEPYPQKVFEAGDTVEYSGSLRQRRKLAAVVTSYDASFEEAHAPLWALLASLGLKPRLKPEASSLFIEGRSAAVEAQLGRLGVIGEVSPSILERFQLTKPAAAFEIDLSTILEWLGAGKGGCREAVSWSIEVRE